MRDVGLELTIACLQKREEGVFKEGGGGVTYQKRPELQYQKGKKQRRLREVAR